MGNVVFCIPTLTRPYQQMLDALEASVPALDAAGWHHQTVFEVGCPYISHARATMLRKALDAGADTIVFIDHDLSWRPEDMLRLLDTDADLAAGMYRYRKDDEHYMGSILEGEDGRPQVREDGAVKGYRVPAGFLKITVNGVKRFMRAYPDLVFGDPLNPAVDLFNHGAHQGIWYGEDMAFSRRWLGMGGDIWIVPDIDLTHWAYDPKAGEFSSYPGNFHRFLLKQPGGSEQEGD